MSTQETKNLTSEPFTMVLLDKKTGRKKTIVAIFKPEINQVHFGQSLVGKNDIYNKQIGKNIAIGRASKTPIIFPIPEVNISRFDLFKIYSALL